MTHRGISILLVIRVKMQKNFCKPPIGFSPAGSVWISDHPVCAPASNCWSAGINFLLSNTIFGTVQTGPPVR